MPIEDIPLVGNIANMLGLHSEGWRSNAQLKADQETRAFMFNNLKEAEKMRAALALLPATETQP